MELVVDCPPLAEPAYVDRDMWEKIVLNLLSNAFKYTLEGRHPGLAPAGRRSIALTVRRHRRWHPGQELPHVFERFHRVEGIQGRTHEGTGIGLALVQELVRLHGGSVTVVSQPGAGSTFTVTIPSGAAHLPADRVGATPLVGPTTLGRDAVCRGGVALVAAGRTGPAARGRHRNDVPGGGRIAAAATRPRYCLPTTTRTCVTTSLVC